MFLLIQRQMSEALMRAMNDMEMMKQEKSKLEAVLGESIRSRDKDSSNYQARIADLEAELQVSLYEGFPHTLFCLFFRTCQRF